MLKPNPIADKGPNIGTTEHIESDVPEPLANRVIRGGFYVFALNLICRGFEFVRTIILARLLLPSDFGLVGAAGAAIAAIEAFSGTGFTHALIQKKGSTAGYLDTAWLVSAIRGLLIFGILFFCAPLVARFFGNEAIIWVLRATAFTSVLSGFTNIGIVYFQKNLRFERQLLLDFAVVLVSLFVSITLAIKLRSVWAIVYGGLAGSFIKLILSYALHSYRPKLRFDFAKAAELFGYGKWILGSSILWFIVLQGDDIFVGKMLGLTLLGFYQLAYRIGNIPATEISHVINRVTFPAYSKLQDEPQRLRHAFLDVLQLTSIILIPLVGAIFSLAYDFINIFVGYKWVQMVPAMKVLALAGLIRAIGVTSGSVFLATGKPAIDTRWQAVRLFILAVLIYPLAVQWDILGVSLAVLFSTLVTTIAFSVYAIKITRCALKDFLKRIVLPLLGGCIMVVVISIFRPIFVRVGFLEFTFLGVLGILSYILTVYIWERFYDYRIISLLMKIFQSLKNNIAN